MTSILRGHRGTLLALVGVVMALATLVADNGAGTAAPTPEPWPPFVMTYRETAVGLGLNGAVGAQRIRVEYTNRRSFKTTVLEHSAAPEVVGSTVVYDGKTAVHYLAHLKQTYVTPVEPTENLVIGPWLIPGKVPALAGRPGATPPRALGNGLGVVSREWTDGQRFREEVTYRLSDGIPTRIVESVDGREVRRIEVESLSVGGR